MTATRALNAAAPGTVAGAGVLQHEPDLPPPAHTCLDALRADRVTYLADLIAELQVLAQQAQCPTLAGILGLAHAEARQQVQRPGSY